MEKIQKRKHTNLRIGKVKYGDWLCMILMSAFLLLPGCSSDEGEPVVGSGLVEICLTGGINSSAAICTRGEGMLNGTETWSSDLAAQFARADQADNYSAGYLSTPLDAVVSKTATGELSKMHDITFGTSSSPLSAYYQSDGKNSKLIGWYPASEVFNLSENTVSFSNTVLDGSTDLMVTNLYEGNRRNRITSVTFKHLLTQVSIKVCAESSAVVTAWGELSSMTIQHMKQSCILTLPVASAMEETGVGEATAVFSGVDDLSLVAKNPSGNEDIGYPLSLPVGTDNALLAGYAMFAPQVSETPSENAITLSVETTVDGIRTVVIAAPEGGFKAGYSYLVTLKFGAAKVEPLISITDWLPGTVPGEVEI